MIDKTKFEEILSRIETASEEEAISARLFKESEIKKAKGKKKMFSTKVDEIISSLEQAGESIDNRLKELVSERAESGSDPVQLTLDGRDYSTSLVDSVNFVLTGNMDDLIAELESSMPLLVETKKVADTKTLQKLYNQGNAVAVDIVNKYYNVTTQVQAKVSSKKSKGVK